MTQIANKTAYYREHSQIPTLFDELDLEHRSLILPQSERLEEITSLTELVSLALSLGAATVPNWSPEEEKLAQAPVPVSQETVGAALSSINSGHDPLGDVFCRILSRDERRPLGAIYTPEPIVDAMLAWASREIIPARIVDPGAGSGRFLVKAARLFPDAELIGIEVDPIAAILARGHIAGAGLAERAQIRLGDFREIKLTQIEGRTLYRGNPPYVRHHLIDANWKSWLVKTAAGLGLDASKLSGLHVHFFLTIAASAKAGDVGIFITAAEWLDVNYGRLVRELLLGPLGGKSIQIIQPTAEPFPGTATTAAITGFEIGSREPSIDLRRITTIEEIGQLEPTIQVRRERFENAHRWSPLTRATVAKREGFVELGELCRVHRGQVTGKNSVWIEGDCSAPLPNSVLFRSVTRARELFAADGTLADASLLKRVIDIPTDLDQFDDTDRSSIENFLRIARGLGADKGFIAEHRKAWWSVSLRTPAPILATYMARRPPAFVRNVVDARHINVAHGLYPRDLMSDLALRTLAEFLSTTTSTNEGRTYAGGLTKFEPREMERLIVPNPDLLAAR